MTLFVISQGMGEAREARPLSCGGESARHHLVQKQQHGIIWAKASVQMKYAWHMYK